MKEIKNILASIRIADTKYNLISKKDRIAIGISGGKDSMALFFALDIYSKFETSDFEIVPIMLNLGFPKFDPSCLLDFFKLKGYKLNIYDATTVYPILKENTLEGEHLPCSICSKMKKCLIDKAAKEFNCNKVAFAHHKDDAIETLFLNEIYGGRIATFSPKMHLTNDNITFIRPLILAKESDIIKLVKEENIPVMKTTCPADKHTERENIKSVLKTIYKAYPQSENNFLLMLSNYERADIWFDKEENKIGNTDLCFYEAKTFKDFSKIYHLLDKSITKIDADDKIYILAKNNKIIALSLISLQKPNIFVKQTIFKNDKLKDKYEEIYIFYLEKYFYKKYNPCVLNIKSSLKYVKQTYLKSNKYYSKVLERNMKEIKMKK